MKRLLKKLVIESSSNPIIQVGRYLVAGGTAFMVDFATLWLLSEKAELSLHLSVVVAYVLGLIITYTLSIYWIFDKRQRDNWRSEFTIFAIIGLIGLALTSLFMWLFTDILLLHYMLSKIITTIVVFVWNFIAKKRILF